MVSKEEVSEMIDFAINQHNRNAGQISMVLGFTFMALFATIVQATIPDSIRGRVTSVNNLHIGGSMALCNLMNGALADILGAPILLFIPGVAFAIIMVVSLRFPSLQMFYGVNKLRQ